VSVLNALTLQVTPDGIIRFDRRFEPTAEDIYREHGSDFIPGPLPWATAIATRP